MPFRNVPLIITLILFCACHSKSEYKKEAEKKQPPKQLKMPVEQPSKKQFKIHYSPLAIKHNDSAINYFRKHFTDEQKQIIYSLNRIDARNLWRPDSLIIPDTFLSNWLLYSPFPQYADCLASVHKLVLFSYPIQAFAAYENGKLVRWGPTSLGRKTHPTPTGLHFANWKSKKSVSTVKDEWILPWNFNIVNKAGVGWHEYSMPGYPASHSCLRLHEADAEWLYYWAEQWILIDDQTLAAKGTPVIVFGQYPWGKRRPWRNLLEDAKANTLSEKELREVIKPYYDEIMEAQEKRAQVLAEKNAPDTAKAQ